MLKFFRLRSRASSPSRKDLERSLDAFGSESTDIGAGASPGSARPGNGRVKIAAVLVVLCAVVAATVAYVLLKSPAYRVEASSASLVIESQPAGASVLAGGVPQGKTPLTLSIPPGEHRLEVVLEGRRREVVATARPGATVVHHVTFEPLPAASPQQASLRIVTDPEKLPVLLNGVARGVSPLILTDVAPGQHTVRVLGTSGIVERSVDVQPGESASLIVAVPAVAKPSVGWLSVESAVPLQVHDGKDILGTSRAPKIMLTAGRRQLRLVNDALGFSEARAVTIRAGAGETIRVTLPKAPLSINAVPWAEVWIDGERVGETPIGNRMVPLGSREVVFKHPELGERRRAVTVSLLAPARLSVDMRRPE